MAFWPENQSEGNHSNPCCYLCSCDIRGKRGLWGNSVNSRVSCYAYSKLFYVLGNYGNTIDGQFVRDDLKDEADGEDERFIQSLTPPFKPTSSDRQYYYITFEDTKPCMHIKFPYQDHRRRLYLSNMLYKIMERLVRFHFNYMCELVIILRCI